MIRPIDTPSSPEALPQAQPAPAAAAPAGTGKDFARMHAAAVARESTTGATVTGGTAAPPAAATPPTAPVEKSLTASPTPAAAEKQANGTGGTSAAKDSKTVGPHERVVAPEGETWAATKKGSHYARIITGPRTGDYINLSRGERRGQTFSIEHRDGKVIHVYGAGDSKVDVTAAADRRAAEKASRSVPTADQPRRGERWAPVEGHSTYADILDGPRNGFYVNISGGGRDGMAFQIVKKDGKWWHVYGTGKDRQWIPSDGPKSARTEGTSGSTGASGSTPSATGVGSTTTGGSTATGGTTATAAADRSSGTGGTAAPSV